MNWPTKDVLDIASLDRAHLEGFLQFAETFEGEGSWPHGKDRTVVLLFYENSTRTRVSFELAAKSLGCRVSVVDVAASSVTKGESLRDTLVTLEAAGAEVVVIRHSQSRVLHQAAPRVKMSVINAGDGTHEHPSQGLLDMFTLRKHFGSVEGLKVALIGDILHSRVARSNFHALLKLGARPYAVGPSTLLPPGLSSWGVQVTTRLDDVLREADVLYVLRLQQERMQRALIPTLGDYARTYQINADRLRLTKSTCMVMHPGPMNRGVEISGDVADGPRSLITKQVANGVVTRRALLASLFKYREQGTGSRGQGTETIMAASQSAIRPSTSLGTPIQTSPEPAEGRNPQSAIS